MKSNEKDPKKQAENTKNGNSESNKAKSSASQWHKLGTTGLDPGPDPAASGKEPILRGSTTDSSRVPKNPNDDIPTGGNIR